MAGIGGGINTGGAGRGKSVAVIGSVGVGVGTAAWTRSKLLRVAEDKDVPEPEATLREQVARGTLSEVTSQNAIAFPLIGMGGAAGLGGTPLPRPSTRSPRPRRVSNRSGS